MNQASDWEMAAREAWSAPGHQSARRLYRGAWIAASIGLIMVIIGDLSRAVFWGSVFVDGYNWEERIRFSWLSSIAGLLGYIGVILLIVSIVFVIDGLRKETNRQRTVANLVGTLGSLKWLAIVALILYVAIIPVGILSYFSILVIVITYAIPASLFLSAMPFVIARALNKG